MVQTKEEKNAYQKDYYQKNKEKKKAYYQKNKEKIKQQHIEWYQKNKEKVKEKNKEYNQTEQGKKMRRISEWKRMGIICDDYEALYNQYIHTSNCENCNIELTEDKVTTSTTRCLDHNHDTGEFRNVVCHSCNVRIG